MATPHKHAVIQPDSYFASYYKSIEKAWRNNSNLNHINLISIGGGIRDLLVRSDLIADPVGHINVLVSNPLSTQKLIFY